jgi:hypothetical protein
MAEEQSHREEMNAAIRAQRERQGRAAKRPGAKPSLTVRLAGLFRRK